MTSTFTRAFATVTTLVFMVVALASPASALDRRVRIVNNTGYTIVEFYGSNKGADSWQEDILGYDVLGPYSSQVINFDDGSGYCKFDFKAVFNNGNEAKDYDINICQIGSFTYN